MCELCGVREPQTQNTEDTNIGMIEGYAQDIVDICGAWRDGTRAEGLETVEELLEEVKYKVAYLADHMAAL